MKRKSTASAAAAAKRTKAMINEVVHAITDSEAVAADLRALFKTTLPAVLETNKEDRHAYQAEVVGQAGEALKLVQAERANAHKAAMDEQNKMIAPAEQQQRAKAKTDAESALEAAKAKVEADKSARKDCEKAVHDAEAGLKEAKANADKAVKAAVAEEKKADQELKSVVGKKEALTGVLATEFNSLSDAAADSKTKSKAVAKVLAVGREYHLDATLMQTLPMAAKKSVESRTEFENMMFKNLEDLINGAVGKLSEGIASAEPAKAAKSEAVAAAEAAKEASVGAAQATLQTAKDALQAAEATLEASQKARSDAAHDLSKADKTLRNIWEDMRQACDKQDEAAEELKTLKEGVMIAYDTLKEKAPEPEPVEEEPAAAEAPAEPVAEPAA